MHIYSQVATDDFVEILEGDDFLRLFRLCFEVKLKLGVCQCVLDRYVSSKAKGDCLLEPLRINAEVEVHRCDYFRRNYTLSETLSGALLNFLAILVVGT